MFKRFLFIYYMNTFFPGYLTSFLKILLTQYPEAKCFCELN